MTCIQQNFLTSEHKHSFIARFKQYGLDEQVIQEFQQEIYRFYKEQGRQLSWRTDITPYRVVVSEIMLQQTQVHRVAAKFDTFVDHFADFAQLASAPLSAVLSLWSGLGYNRRAKALHQIAKIVQEKHQGVLPNNTEVLELFPGIGKATAASIITYAYNIPTVFIETNIRTVFFYFFFKDLENIPDQALAPLVAQTLDRHNPRDWYYALMDYGTMLKKTVGNLNTQSKHYARQSHFQGSDRQIRGMILKLLVTHGGPLKEQELIAQCQKDPARTTKILQDLISEGFITQFQEIISLKRC